MQKVFFLGLGGQKCGSSWIQAYLARQSGSDFGRLGEYQVWEHHLGGVFARYKVAQPSLRTRLRAGAKRLVGASEPVAHLRWRLQADPNAYFDYFDQILNQPGIVRTGDISPSYAALTPELLHQIKSGMEARGHRVKVIFSMRDPVDRIHSHMRMEIAKGRLPHPENSETALAQFYPGDEAAARTRYDATLGTIAQVFSPNDTYTCLFESLFTPQGTAELAAFCDVPVETEAGKTRVNARAGGRQVSPDLASDIAGHYAPVYHAVAARHPLIKDLWPSARFLDL
ncbi:MAG: sulfotransferase family protein [Pelagimonas sp.]|jgi:hypothetical protein|nr:sulfotransferase family protein [Pelagimonas sp.]